VCVLLCMVRCDAECVRAGVRACVRACVCASTLPSGTGRKFGAQILSLCLWLCVSGSLCVSLLSLSPLSFSVSFLPLSVSLSPSFLPRRLPHTLAGLDWSVGCSLVGRLVGWCCGLVGRLRFALWQDWQGDPGRLVYEWSPTPLPSKDYYVWGVDCDATDTSQVRGWEGARLGRREGVGPSREGRGGKRRGGAGGDETGGRQGGGGAGTGSGWEQQIKGADSPRGNCCVRWLCERANEGANEHRN
jgi:hypothetical protein